MSLVDIRIEGLDKLTADIERIRKDSSIRWPKEIMDHSAEILKDAIVDEATGSLRDKVIIVGTGDMRSVFVDSPYAIYVNDGTGPSRGRYVPAIGKRLIHPTWKIGMHPGIKGSHFFDRGVAFATTSIYGFVHRKIYEYLLE